MDDFDPEDELAKLRAQARVARRQRKSKLTRYASQLLALRAAGATAADCQRWLKTRHMPVAHTTVTRWFKRNG